MSALDPVRDQLARLIPRLFSPFEGERLATVAAIERTLKAKQLDVHDLAEAVAAGPPPPRIIFVERPPRDPETWQGIAEGLRDHDAGRLKPHERRFVHQMAAELVLGGEPSERQANWLRVLRGRLRRASA